MKTAVVNYAVTIPWGKSISRYAIERHFRLGPSMPNWLMVYPELLATLDLTKYAAWPATGRE